MSFRAFRVESYPFADQWSGIALGTAVMFAAVLGLISPRTFAGTFPVVALAFVAWGFARGLKLGGASPWGRAMAAFAAFAGYAIAASFWTEAPLESLARSGVMAAIGAGAIAAACYVLAETRADIIRIAEGLWLGVVFGGLFLLIETLSGQAIKIWTVNAMGLKPGEMLPADLYTWKRGRLVRVSLSNLTRNLPGLLLLAIPAALGAWYSLARPWNKIVAIAVIMMLVLAVLLSPSESSKLALAAGLAILLVSSFSLRWSRRVLIGMWCAGCLLIVPAVYGAHGLALQENQLVKSAFKGGSVEARLMIWKGYADRYMEAPLAKKIFGHGSYSAYLMHEAQQGPSFQAVPHDKNWVRPHPHNVYLQVWFELGAVGAILLAALGVSVLMALSKLPRREQIGGYSLFAAAASLILASYGLWQSWLMSVAGLTVICFAAGLRASRLKLPKQGP